MLGNHEEGVQLITATFLRRCSYNLSLAFRHTHMHSKDLNLKSPVPTHTSEGSWIKSSGISYTSSPTEPVARFILLLNRVKAKAWDNNPHLLPQCHTHHYWMEATKLKGTPKKPKVALHIPSDVYFHSQPLWSILTFTSNYSKLI